MNNSEKIMKVIEQLGTALQEKETTITCQQYEINQLKRTIESIEDKLNAYILIE